MFAEPRKAVTVYLVSCEFLHSRWTSVLPLFSHACSPLVCCSLILCQAYWLDLMVLLAIHRRRRSLRKKHLLIPGHLSHSSRHENRAVSDSVTGQHQDAGERKAKGRLDGPGPPPWQKGCLYGVLLDTIGVPRVPLPWTVDSTTPPHPSPPPLRGSVMHAWAVLLRLLLREAPVAAPEAFSLARGIWATIDRIITASGTRSDTGLRYDQL